MKTKSFAVQKYDSESVQPIQVADLMLEETVSRDENQIIYTGSARQYRADCQVGQFKIGAAKMVGSTLKLELIAARVMEGEFFGYSRQKWINVIFVDPDGIVSSTLFKTESMDNLLELHRQALAKGDILLGKAIQAKMGRRSSRESGKGYYAVEFEIAGDGVYGSAIAQFRQETVIDGIYRTMLGKSERHDAD